MMKKRIIGGTLFVVILFLSFLFEVFKYLNTLFLLIALYELLIIFKKKKKYKYKFFYTFLFLIGIYAMYVLNNIGVIYLFIMTSLIMLNDTFAYLVGKKYGKNKFSKISPNKTLEGALGGIIISSLILVLFTYTIDSYFTLSFFSKLPIYITLIIAIILTTTSIIGDILESKLKRNSDIKDSGTVIYGHGGILDRIDSWIIPSIIMCIIALLN